MIGAKISITYVTSIILGICINVTVCGNHVLRKENIAAHRALATFGQACLGASRCFAVYSLGCVTESSSAIRIIAVSAYGTGVGDVALVFTIGGGNCGIVAVTERLNVLGVGVRRCLTLRRLPAQSPVLPRGKYAHPAVRCLQNRPRSLQMVIARILSSALILRALIAVLPMVKSVAYVVP